MKLGTTLKGVTGKRMKDRNLILKEIIKNHKFDTVLDLGCGIGDLFKIINPVKINKIYSRN
jgi:16S rRNA G1207 methylase RsmC